MGGGPPSFTRSFTGSVLLWYPDEGVLSFAYGTITLCGRTFQTFLLHRTFVTLICPGPQPPDESGFGLIPFRSPLLGKSRFLSFPPGTKMFQFPGLPPTAYAFNRR